MTCVLGSDDKKGTSQNQGRPIVQVLVHPVCNLLKAPTQVFEYPRKSTFVITDVQKRVYTALRAYLHQAKVGAKSKKIKV